MIENDWPAVVLDLLNTTPVVGGVPGDELEDEGAARAWLRARGGKGDLGKVRRLRDDLQAVVRGERDPATLNDHLGGARRVPRVGRDGLTWSLVDADWTARIVLAWGDVQADSPGRLRPCANLDCRLFLLDRTRAGTARWCSMSVCGNRMKARRHYGRTAGEPG